jgi:hypothetical protein
MSRLDKLKEQHPELNISIIDIIGMIDPTDTYKYSEFLIKILKRWYDNLDIRYGMGVDFIGEENVEILNEFEKHCKAKRIEKNDISQHSDFISLKNEVKKANEILRVKESEKQTKKIFDNDEWLVIVPLSYEASKMYGMNTKWCTTELKYWNKYITNYKLVYILNKKTNDKYSISRDKTDDTDIKAWLSDDTEISPLLLPIPQELWSLIILELQKQESVIDLVGGNIIDNIKPNDSVMRVVQRVKTYSNPDLFADPVFSYDKEYMNKLMSEYITSSLFTNT